MITSQEAVPVNLRIGWGRLRPKCLQFLNGPKWFLFFLTIFSAIQGMTVGGITNVSLPTLEKRFQFESTHLGFIAGSNDISGIVLVCFVSFYGGFGNKIKWLGYGALLTGIGCITFVLPHLLIGPYDPLTKNGQPSLTLRSQQTQDLCYLRNTTTHPEEKTCFSGYGSNWYHLMIFSIAQMLMGAGTTPLYSLGPAYIDENVHPKAAPIYLGVWFAATLLGPGLGFIVGGSILSVYVDIKLPKGVVLTPNDSRWIGAWWLGYFIGGCILIASSVGILAFPAQLPGTQEMREKAIKEGDLPSRDEKIQGKLKDILPATLKLLKNPTYIFNTVGLTVGSMWGIGIVTFIAKILILKFGVNPVMSGIVIGCVLIPGCVCGILLGGYLVRRFNLKESCKQSAKYCFIIKCIGIVGALVWLIPGCSEIKMAGITVPYHNSTLSTRSLSSTCNVACGCDLAERNPVCGSDNIVYFSPCQAGCKATVKRGVYSNCSCIPPRFDERESRATAGYCDKGPGCKNVSYFLASFIVLILVVFVGGIPNKTVVLRSVPDNQRAYALGFQFVFQRAMGFLPGPMLIGFLFDSLCLLWGQSCNKRGSCQVYDIEQLSYRLTGFAFMFSFVSGFFYLLSWRLYKPNNNNEQALRETIFMKEDQDKELLNMETAI